MPNPVLGGARPRRATVLMLVALVAVPAAVAATPPSTGEADGAGVPSQEVVLPRDPAEADLGRAVGSLDARIKAERAEADLAARSMADARARLQAADAAVAEAEHRVHALVARAGTPTPGFLGAGSEGRPRSPRSQPAPTGRPALPLPLNVDAAMVERFVEARDRLVAEARKRADAEAVAKDQARRAEAARAEAEADAARRAEFLDDAQQRLTEELDEAATADDRGRQAVVKARRDELVAIVEAPARAAAARKAKAEAAARAKAEAEARAKAEAEAAALRPGPIGPPTRKYPAVGCPGGGSITIDGSLAHNLNALIGSAWRDGVNLCGGGYRDPRQQIRLRVQNCGSSDYAVWHKPPGSCSPPTAIPGTSMHEQGLAVDFRCSGHGMPSRSIPCFGWMAAHAAAFGFFNLPSEPWHWSTSGS
jgi:D-alanyl-D-alanine carboxypeptidase